MSIYIDPIEKWEKTEEVDGVKKSKTVAKVENGYIIVTSKSGRRPREDGDGDEYYEESKAFISKDNPLEEMNIKAGVSSLVDGLI